MCHGIVENELKSKYICDSKIVENKIMGNKMVENKIVGKKIVGKKIVRCGKRTSSHSWGALVLSSHG